MTGKYGYLIKLIISTAAVYFAMKYLLPLFLPFLIAYVISGCILPIVTFLHKKMKFNHTIAVLLVLILFVIVAGALIGILGYQIYVQGSSFIGHLPDGIGRTARNFVNDNREKIVSFAMDGTMKTVMIMIQALVFIVTVIISAYFITKDRKKIHEYRKRMPYHHEINRICAKLKQAFSAYVKAQLIIMAVTTVICTIGLYVLRNPYALLLGILVSFLDALPLIGAGVILLPWAAYYFFVGKIINGTVLFIVFVVCYIAREVLEPKIMGHGIGMPPLISVISIYVGYLLFGIIGVIIGPVSYIIIGQLVKEEKDGEGEKS